MRLISGCEPPFWSTQITRLVDAESAIELNCIVSPCANLSQLYYTSCRRGVRSGTELYCFALC